MIWFWYICISTTWARPSGRPRHTWLNHIQDADARPLSTIWRSEVARGHGGAQRSVRTPRWWWWWCIIRACLDHHLIGIRSPEIEGDHVQSGTSLIAIIYIAGLSHLLTWHLATVIQCTVLQDATQLGGWELSQHQQPVVHCKGRSRGPWVRGAAVGSCRE